MIFAYSGEMCRFLFLNLNELNGLAPLDNDFSFATAATVATFFFSPVTSIA